MAKQITGIVDWLKNWFYDKGDVDGFVNTLSNSINGKLNKNLTEANKMLITDGSGNVALENKPVIPDISGKADKTGGVQQITDNNAHSNIGTTANATQGQINTAIDNKISELSRIGAIEVVQSLPTASSSTMGKLYIISENSKINVYYTVQDGSNYSWHEMDTDILDDLSISWTDVQNRPTKTSDFTNDGADGTNAFVANNDSRLSDARTPTSHSHGNISNNGKLVINGNVQRNNLLMANGDGDIVGTYDIGTGIVIDPYNRTNIGSNARDTVTVVVGKIDTAIGNINTNISNKQDEITSIVLVPKSTDANGKIIFYTGDEPT